MPGVCVGASFADLGIPFPLFEGPVDGTEFCGLATCTLCRRPAQNCFHLGVGDYVMTHCAACGSLNGLSASDLKDGLCRSCGAQIPFPAVGNSKEVRVCYDCLREGRAALTKDTELGMISWEQALEGVTNGVPRLKRTDFELVPREDDWVAVRLPQEMMFELLRTPTYCSWQGERWLFCCQRPMVYVGNWTSEDFCEFAPDRDGSKFLYEVIADACPGIWAAVQEGQVSTYVFRCPACRKFAGHSDTD
jgi:uncharacterized protein CbrC (UPF0167 family)